MKKEFDKIGKCNVFHNLSESVDFHDTCKTLLMRMLYRKNKKALIYSEYHPLRENKVYPDVLMYLGKHFYVFELQSAYSDSWLKQLQEKYEMDDNTTLIPINLNKIKMEWSARINESGDPLEVLKKILEDYVI